MLFPKHSTAGWVKLTINLKQTNKSKITDTKTVVTCITCQKWNKRKTVLHLICFSFMAGAILHFTQGEIENTQVSKQWKGVHQSKFWGGWFGVGNKNSYATFLEWKSFGKETSLGELTHSSILSLLFQPHYNGHFLLSPRWPLWRYYLVPPLSQYYNNICVTYCHT